MQTRKRVLQEWKKSFKVRLVFGHSKIPMEVRKPSKSTYMHQSCSCYKPYDVIQVKEKSQLSLPKN